MQTPDPQNYLVLIHAADVLEALYGRVVIPEMVARELVDSGTPDSVRQWVSNPPHWFEIHPDPPLQPALGYLGLGEAAALSLAVELNASQLLIDERMGRREAVKRCIPVTGTLGVLAEAHVAGLLTFDTAMTALRKTNFRLSDEVESLVRQRLTGR